jgi:hypothetical protein
MQIDMDVATPLVVMLSLALEIEALHTKEDGDLIIVPSIEQ